MPGRQEQKGWRGQTTWHDQEGKGSKLKTSRGEQLVSAQRDEQVVRARERECKRENARERERERERNSYLRA
jgi:hypothetical protein